MSKKEDRDFSSSLRHALRIGLLAIDNPELTAEEIKDIKGEFKDLRSLRYFAEGRERRLIYKAEQNALHLLSFGPKPAS